METSEKPLPVVIPRANHPISRKQIDEEALKVLYRLHHHGFLAYLVGGSVRDLLLGKTPKDFDVATNARPHEIKDLFRNSRIIGRRFRLVQVFFKSKKTIEVSTFRSHSEFEEIQDEDGHIIRTESFGTPEEDAYRRDITINGLFYNIADFTVLDYVGGIEDLRRGIIRTIGDPHDRFMQDPVRMIRVIRHAARTKFRIEDHTYNAILQDRNELARCSPARLRDEFLRDLKEGFAQSSLALMLRTNLLFSLFPDFERPFGDPTPQHHRNEGFLLDLFGLVDQRVREGNSFPESTLIALILTPVLQAITTDPTHLGGREEHITRIESIRWALHQGLAPLSFPKGAKEGASQILIAQSLLRKAVQRRMIPRRLRMKRYFQEAALLFGMEAEAKGESVSGLLGQAARSDFLRERPKPHKRRRRRRAKQSHLPA